MSVALASNVSLRLRQKTVSALLHTKVVGLAIVLGVRWSLGSVDAHAAYRISNQVVVLVAVVGFEAEVGADELDQLVVCPRCGTVGVHLMQRKCQFRGAVVGE